MNLENIKNGVYPAIFQLGVIVIGGLDQIRAIWTAQSVAGVSIIQLAMIMAACLFWTAYAKMNNNRALLVPQITAISFTSVVIGEYIYLM